MPNQETSYQNQKSTPNAPSKSSPESAASLSASAGEHLRDARDRVVDSYQAGAEYIEDKARALGERAEEMVDAVGTQLVRTGRSTRRFASGNALPLLMIGAGIGWLIFRSIGQRPRVERGPIVTTRYPLAAGTSGPADYREGSALAASTPSGARLMGVRTSDRGYGE